MVFSKAKDLLKSDERVLFVIVENDAQIMAKRIHGRELTDEELYSVSKGLEWGLDNAYSITLRTAVEEAVSK